jgi:hypothetical protein
MKTKDLKYYTNFVSKAAAGFERIKSILKEVLLWVKCYHTASHATEKSFLKRKVNQFCKLHFCLIIRKMPQPSQPSATITPISQQPSTLR